MGYKKLYELSRDQFLTPSECRDLCAAPNRRTLLGLRDYAILKTFLNLGLRRQELINLKVKDIFQDGNDWIVKIHGKGGTEDEIDIQNYDLLEAIRKYLVASGHAKDQNAYLFQSIRLQKSNTTKILNRKSIVMLLEKYRKMAKIQKPIHAHTLRHTFGTELFSLTKDITIVQRAMRHRSMQSTMLYMHTNRDRLKNGLAQLSL